MDFMGGAFPRQRRPVGNELLSLCRPHRPNLADAPGQLDVTIVIVSHDLPAVERFTDRVLLMRKGEVVADGEPGAIIRRYRREEEQLASLG